VIYGGAGFDFIDGGAGNDYLFGQEGNDILRGGANTDFLFGGQGDDTYVFNRGDGVDTVLDDFATVDFVPNPNGSGGVGGTLTGGVGNGTYQTVHHNGGSDSLLFGPGISRADIAVVRTGNDLKVLVKDPAHPGAQTDQITLQNWADVNDRVENFRFADGSTLDLSGGDAALAAFLVPFGAALSGQSVVEKSAIGTVVGTVTGFDLAGGSLTYSLDNDAGGRFAINAATGVLTVASAIDYNAGQSWQVAVRISDGGGHVAGQAFTINVIDIPNRAPVLSVPASSITVSAGQSLQVASLFGATDADGDTLTYNFKTLQKGRIRTETANRRKTVRAGGWRRVQPAMASMPCICKRFA
jgi:RTX calcium-binding nonapeptide repeat (4 copies)/Haemolysin-type calcium binding protein related domain/Cadherin domain